MLTEIQNYLDKLKYSNQGRLLRGNDKKTGKREGIEPIKSVSTYVLFSVTHFL